MITFACSCGRELKAREEFVGKRAKCPTCSAIITIPRPAPSIGDDDLDDGLPYGLTAPDSSAPTWTPNSDRPAIKGPATTFQPIGTPTPFPPSETLPNLPRADTAWRAAPPDQADKAKSRGGKSSGSKSWKPEEPEGSGRDLVYWAFVFALIPLAVSILGGEGMKVQERLAKAIEAMPEARADHVVRLLNDEKADISQVLAEMPDGKLDADAHLSASTYLHWFYAAISASLFLAILGCMFTSGSAPPLSLAKVALFTSTVGILLLTILQLLANFTGGGIRVFRGRGLIAIVMLFVFLISFSYQAALDPDNGFWLSMLGFTLGVGFCEELCKALPLLWHFSSDAKLGWRGACLWGLASGVGFGVSEGVLYSANHYNGIATLNTYLVRFLSCVALHAMWSGAVGISLEQNQESVQMDWDDDFFSALLGLLRVLAVPMILHGLYDTLLKKDMDLYALGVAIVTFAWFAGTIESAKRQEDNAAFG